MKLVSVVLPVHNGDKYLHESIHSILGQSYQNIELIIVNDRSKDNSLEIINQLLPTDKRIKLLHNTIGGKLPGSLNVGFSHANGDYYTWWSDDNIMLPCMIEKMVDILDSNPEYGCVTGNYTNINENGSKINDKILDTAQSVLVQNNFSLVFLYRKEIAKIVGDYNTELFLIEDYDYFIRMSLITQRYHIPEILGLYRIHDESLSSKYHIDVQQKDAELKYHYLEQFKDTLNSSDYFKILLKIARYHPDKLFRLMSVYTCVMHFPQEIGSKLYQKIKS